MDVLSEFDAKLIEASDGRCEVMVTLRGSGQETVAVLNALERFVTERDRCARLTLNGREYVMQSDPAA
jgi:hypothetical protein